MAKFELTPLLPATARPMARLRAFLRDMARAYVAARQSRVTYGAL